MPIVRQGVTDVTLAHASSSHSVFKIARLGVYLHRPKKCSYPVTRWWGSHVARITPLLMSLTGTPLRELYAGGERREIAAIYSSGRTRGKVEVIMTFRYLLHN